VASHVIDMWSPSTESLLDSSRVFPRRCHGIIPCFPLTNRSPLVVFRLNPARNTDSPKLKEIVSLNLLFYDIDPFSSFIQGRLMVYDVC
jgi:hypothetical protein